MYTVLHEGKEARVGRGCPEWSSYCSGRNWRWEVEAMAATGLSRVAMDTALTGEGFHLGSPIHRVHKGHTELAWSGIDRY